MKRFSTGSLARLGANHPWWMVGAWVVVFAIAVVLASGVGSVLTNEDEVYVDLEAERAEDLMVEHLGVESIPTMVVLIDGDGTSVDDPAFRDVYDQVASVLRAMPQSVTGIIDYYETGDPTLVGTNGDALQIPVALTSVEAGLDVDEALTPMRDAGGLRVIAVGDEIINETFDREAESSLQAEFFALPIALVILIVVFGAVVAAGVPIILAFLSIVVAVAMTFLLGQAFELSTFVTNMITMIGLAVGIDYSLLVVQRFREERSRGVARDDAIEIAGSTATRAVLFSGIAVMISLAGLIIVPQSIFRSLAIGAIFSVVAAVVAAMTLLPAVLRLMGDRVNTLRVRLPRFGRPPRREAGNGFWGATANFVMKHAVASIVVTVTLLVAAAVPYRNVELGFAGVSLLPGGTEARDGFELLDSDFNAGVLEPADIVVDANDVSAAPVQGAVDRLLASLAADDAFGEPVITTSDDGELLLVEAPIRGDANSDAAKDSLARLRSDYIPAAFAGVNAEVHVGGLTAETVDFAELVNDYTPIVLAFVLGLSFLILLVVFRSIVVPLKAIVMNLLSVGAAYGLMVLVFQDGIGGSLLGFEQVETIEAWIPLFLFAIIFGLSMDYHVFLLTRIRERYDQTRNNRESVAFGVRSTAGIITGAALIMVAVFAGFAAGDLVMFQQMGFGLATAIILDATIIRVVLVPASMALLGDWNWYLPRWLSWLPKVNVEGVHAPRGVATAGGK